MEIDVIIPYRRTCHQLFYERCNSIDVATEEATDKSGGFGNGFSISARGAINRMGVLRSMISNNFSWNPLMIPMDCFFENGNDDHPRCSRPESLKGFGSMNLPMRLHTLCNIKSDGFLRNAAVTVAVILKIPFTGFPLHFQLLQCPAG